MPVFEQVHLTRKILTHEQVKLVKAKRIENLLVCNLLYALVRGVKYVTITYRICDEENIYASLMYWSAESPRKVSSRVME